MCHDNRHHHHDRGRYGYYNDRCHDGDHWGPDGYGPPDGHHYRDEYNDGHHGPDHMDADRENPFHFERRFVSDAEVLEALEDYLLELENEAQGVREAIDELSAEMEGKEAAAVEAETGKE